MSIASVLADGRLIRHDWAREEDGRQLLCLYTALADDPDARPEACPASLCPQWLAYLLPWMDDKGTDEAWPAMVRRVATLAPQFHRLRPRVEWQVRAACVREAMRYTTDPDSLAVCETVATLCERRSRGEHVSDEGMAAARAAARAAAWAAARAVWAVWAAETAAEAAAAAAEEAARAAAWAAKSAAWATAESVESEARAVAAAEAADRLAATILDLIEADLAATEEIR